MMWTSLVLSLFAAIPEPELRLAVVVGSNHEVEGRARLRYAGSDARELAGVLQATGRFASSDVAVLLDPQPADVLAAVDSAAARAREAKRRSLFVFYFSGHADDRALYPGGEALGLARLKTALEDPAFDVRIGIIDSCRGGGWTQAKGLVPAMPFEVPLPALASEGTALLAASSGMEDAHEAEVLKGSFFTHHLVAGLRGAADQSGDGQVTLSEAFAYADRFTIRDTAIRSAQPQHPSFDMRLRGRQDVVLADVGGSPTVLTMAQSEGPLQLVQLSTGVVVAEATPGKQLVRLAVPPGEYLVRRLTDAGMRARQGQVAAGQATEADEASLTLVGDGALAAKGATQLEGTHALALSSGALPTPYIVAVGVQAMYRRRFSAPFALRVRGLFAFPVETRLITTLQRDFGVRPDNPSFRWTDLLVGADLEWLALSIAGARAGFTLGFSLGASMIHATNFIPAGTATATVALHLTDLAGLALFLEGALHAGGLQGYSLLQPQVNLGVAWHFR